MCFSGTELPLFDWDDDTTAMTSPHKAGDLGVLPDLGWKLTADHINQTVSHPNSPTGSDMYVAIALLEYT